MIYFGDKHNCFNYKLPHVHICIIQSLIIFVTISLAFLLNKTIALLHDIRSNKIETNLLHWVATFSHVGDSVLFLSKINNNGKDCMTPCI